MAAPSPANRALSGLGLRSARPGHNRRGCPREPNGERPGHTPSAGTRAGCRRWRAAGTAHRCTARQRRAVKRSWWQHRDQHRHYRWRCSVTGRQHGPSHPTGPAGPTVSVVHAAGRSHPSRGIWPWSRPGFLYHGCARRNGGRRHGSDRWAGRDRPSAGDGHPTFRTRLHRPRGRGPQP